MILPMGNLLTKNLGWKLLSLALAVVIYYTVRALSRDALTPAEPLESWATRTFSDLSVSPVSTDADVHGFKVNPDAVQVTVSGPPEVLRALTEENVHAIVDLTDIEAADGTKKHVDVSVPRGVTVVLIDPEEVEVVVPLKRSD